MDEILGQLTAEQYWRWRTEIAEMELATKEYDYKRLVHGTKEKDIEILRLKNGIFFHSFEKLKSKAESTKSEYQKYKSELEEGLGFSLENCVIDDIMYEVRRLEDPKKEGDPALEAQAQKAGKKKKRGRRPKS